MDINVIAASTLPYAFGGLLFLILTIKLSLQLAQCATRKANSILALLCFIFALIEWDAFLSRNLVEFAFYGYFELFQNAAHLLLGPLTFLYLQGMSAQPKLGMTSLIHGWAFILGLILLGLEVTEALKLILFAMLYLASLIPYVFLCLKILKAFDLKAKCELSDLQQHNLIGVKIWVYFMAFICCYVIVSPVYKALFNTQTGPIDIQYL